MKILVIASTSALALALCGCPAGQQQQAAQAVDNAATALLAAQNVETAAHEQGLISNTDDAFIQQQFKSLSVIGTAADSCIRGATSTGGAVTCLDTAITGVDKITAQGGTYLKSATAKTYLATGISAVRTVLATIETTIGGTPSTPPAPSGGTI
jgi:hypothetical protein